GRLATRAGPLMAAEDIFEIVVKGRGAHAARPHQAKDALVAACAVVTALQTIVSRTLDPEETAVVSATELLTDGTRNVLPATARIRGDCRSFSPEVSRAIEEAPRNYRKSGKPESNGPGGLMTPRRTRLQSIPQSSRVPRRLASARTSTV